LHYEATLMSMYAIIKSGSRQYQVRPEAVIEVNHLNLEPGAEFVTEDVLLVDEEGKGATVGAPYVSGAKVKGRVLEHFRGEKVIIFKFKRRKNYKRTRGHRQELTRVRIESIEFGSSKATAAPMKAPAKKAPPAEKPQAQDKNFDLASKGKAAELFVDKSEEKPAKAAEKKPAAKAAAKKPAAKKAPAKDKEK